MKHAVKFKVTEILKMNSTMMMSASATRKSKNISIIFKLNSLIETIYNAKKRKKSWNISKKVRISQRFYHIFKFHFFIYLFFSYRKNLVFWLNNQNQSIRVGSNLRHLSHKFMCLQFDQIWYSSISQDLKHLGHIYIDLAWVSGGDNTRHEWVWF